MEEKIKQGVDSLNIYHLVGELTIDEYIEALLAEKREAVDAITDGVERERLERIDIRAELLERMRQKARLN